MAPILGTESFHFDEHIKATNEFHLAYGQTMQQWALIEERLSYWFEDITGLPYEMARAIFFTPRVFASRTELLEAAIKHNTRVCHCATVFIKVATTKAGKLSSFRNSLAHGEQTFDARKGSPTFKQVILISGKHHPYKAAENAVTIARMNNATNNYRELAKLIMDGTDAVNGRMRMPETIEECLRLLNALPNQADSPRPAQN